MTATLAPPEQRAPKISALIATLRAHDGLARMRTLHSAGHSRRTLDLARAAHLVVPVQRGWVALPGTDAHLLSAARHGVVLSCVTQAQRLGLFVLAEDNVPHIAAPPHAGRVNGLRAHIHWAKPVVPRHPDSLTDPIENVLALVAMCRPFEEALIVWESALRQGLADPQQLARLQLPAAARRVLAEADLFSDSGLETVVVPRLRWLRLPLRRQTWIAGRRVDLLIGDRLVLQIDGGHHVGAQREQDIAHDARLTLMGYHVIRVGYTQITEHWAEVQEVIMRAVAQGLHKPR